MVVSPRSSPRPQWAKTGSWRRYIKTTSNRKLLQLDLDSDISKERKVQFDDAEPSVQEVSWDDDEPAETRWYKKSDYEAFERDRQLTALQYRTKKKNGTPFIEREHSVRGLEGLLDIVVVEDDNNSNNNNKQEALSPSSEHVRRVLQEQERQRTEGCFPNHAMLREVSCKSSREARKRSAAMGEADALAGHVTSSRALQRQVQGVMHSISRKMQA